MSAQVDVLAVMDEFVGVVGDEFGNESGLRLRDARDAVAALIAERDALAQEVERLQANGVHSCGPHCQRIACVLGRERDALREALQEMLDADPENMLWVIAAEGQARAALALTTGESAWELLAQIRHLLASLPVDCLGSDTDASGQPYPIRDEVIHGITKLLANKPAPVVDDVIVIDGRRYSAETVRTALLGLAADLARAQGVQS